MLTHPDIAAIIVPLCASAKRGVGNGFFLVCFTFFAQRAERVVQRNEDSVS